MPAFQIEQNKRPVLNGRPSYNYGLPVGLFHPIFDSFQAARKEDLSYADAETYASVRELFKASADIYLTKDDRISAINKPLLKLLGRKFLNIFGPSVESDGVLYQHCGLSNAYLLIREVKNEIGSGLADPYNQASLSYRKYWAEGRRPTE
jgi:hypothetical protein